MNFFRNTRGIDIVHFWYTYDAKELGR